MPKEEFEVGGQAVIEGVMMRSPKFISIAIRKSSGEIIVKKEPYISLVKRVKFLNIPIIRGVVVLFETLYIGIKALSFSANEAIEEEQAKEIQKAQRRKGTLEAGEELVVENAKKYPTLHARCGTSFLLVVMVVSIAVFMFLGRPKNLTDRLVRFSFIPLIAGISYELVKLSAKVKNKNLAKVLIAPGLWLQRMTTKEPDEEQLKVAIAALKNALD